MNSYREEKKSSSELNWRNEQLFHSGDDFYDEVFKEFKKAKKTIYLEIHFYDDKRLGYLFFKEVLAALKRGVSIFIIVDGFSTMSKKLIRWMVLYKKNGGQLSLFHQLPWHQLSLKSLLKLNQRNHKKVILKDKKDDFLGSYNVI